MAALVIADTAYRTETDKEYHKMTKRLTPVKVSGLGGAKPIAAGLDHNPVG